MTKRNGARPEQIHIEQIPVCELTICPEVQREPPSRQRVKDMVAKFDLNNVGIMTVSRRKDGTLSLLDGQTRKAAMAELDLEDWPATCNVYEGLTVAEEAHKFRILNNTRHPTALDDHKVGVTEGDTECLAIQAMVEKHGLKFTLSSGDGDISCISTLRQCYRLDGGSLDKALETAISAWGLRASSVVGEIVGGLAIVFRTYDGQVDQRSLIRKLANYQGGAAGILGQARALRHIRSAPISRLCAATMVSTYNRGKRSGSLPDV